MVCWFWNARLENEITRVRMNKLEQIAWQVRMDTLLFPSSGTVIWWYGYSLIKDGSFYGNLIVCKFEMDVLIYDLYITDQMEYIFTPFTRSFCVKSTCRSHHHFTCMHIPSLHSTSTEQSSNDRSEFLNLSFWSLNEGCLHMLKFINYIIN